MHASNTYGHLIPALASRRHHLRCPRGHAQRTPDSGRHPDYRISVGIAAALYSVFDHRRFDFANSKFVNAAPERFACAPLPPGVTSCPQLTPMAVQLQCPTDRLETNGDSLHTARTRCSHKSTGRNRPARHHYDPHRTPPDVHRERRPELADDQLAQIWNPVPQLSRHHFRRGPRHRSAAPRPPSPQRQVARRRWWQIERPSRRVGRAPWTKFEPSHAARVSHPRHAAAVSSPARCRAGR